MCEHRVLEGLIFQVETFNPQKFDDAKDGWVGEAPARAEQTLSTLPPGRNQKVV